jgi:hypothetical protein
MGHENRQRLGECALCNPQSELAKIPYAPVHVNSCDNPERLKVPQVDHETDVEKWFIDRHRSEKSMPQKKRPETYGLHSR